jgi:TP901 family phage tail tape measure protein
MAEPLGVAFVEIEPVAVGFRAKTEAQLRTQLAGVSAGVPPSPATAASTKQLQGLGVAAGEAATAEELLIAANAQLAESEIRLAAIESGAAKSRLQSVLATEADAAAKQALLAITAETNAATVREIEALNAKTGAATRAAAAEERAAFATASHGTAAAHASGHIAREAGAMTALTAGAAGVSAPMAAAAVAATALFLSVEQADEFNEAMHEIEVATHATAAELDAASDRAVRLGADLNLPLTSSVEAAKAINLLARSGLTLEESMTAAEGALLVSTAAGQDLATSVQQVDRILDAFNLTASDTVLVADQIATGLKFTQGSASEFSSALTTLAPAADSLGLSLQATTTLVLQLAESGLSTTQATGSLRQAFLKLAAGGKGVNEGLAEINLTQADLRDELGRLRPDAFVVLSDALQDLNREEQLRVLTQIFSRRAALGVIRIVEQQREGYDRMTEAAHENGVAQDEAAARAKSLSGRLQEAKDSAADVGRQFGRLTVGPLQQFLDTANAILTVGNNAARVLGELGGAAQDLGTDLLSIIPGGERAGGVIGKIAELSINPLARTEAAARGLGSAFGFVADQLSDDTGKTGEVFDRMSKNIGKSMDDIVAKFDKVGEAMKKLAAQTPVAENLRTQLAVAQAAGDEGAELAAQRRILAAAKERLARNRRRLATGDVGQAAVQQAAADVTAANAAIQAILDGQAADAEAARADAERAAAEIEANAKERDQAFVRAMEAQQQLAQERLTVAAETPELGDDIIANRRLRRFLTRAIAETKARIAQARAAGRDTEVLTGELSSLAADRRAVNREIEQLREQRQQQIADERVESAQLDLQILEARTDDDPTVRQTNLLVRGHQKVIAALKRAQALTKRRSVEWKRLQLEIEQEKEAIRSLRDAAKPDDAAADLASFQKQSFELMQSLQGFSSNLASNLIPFSAAGGLVGTAQPPPTTVTSPFQRADRDRATTTTPVSSGQGNTQIDLLRRILTEVRRSNRGMDHPEAKQQRRTGAAAMDYGGGGGGNMGM